MSPRQCVECGAEATCERVIEELVVHLCARHAAEVDRGDEEDAEMGIHTLEGELDGGPRTGAVLVCSTTGWAFGPVFRSAEDAERFQTWCRQPMTAPSRFAALFAPVKPSAHAVRPRIVWYGADDLRKLDDMDLRRLHTEWITLPDCQWCDERCAGVECEVHDGYLCAPAGELPAGPIGAPDHDEPEITRSRGL